MNRKSPYIFLFLAVLIQMMGGVGIYILMNLSFCKNSTISEETATKLTACLMAVSGISGIFFSSLGIYITILNKKLKVIFPILILVFIPVLFVSIISFYAFLILSSIL